MSSHLQTNQLPQLRSVVMISLFVLFLTMAGSFWLYTQGTSSIQALSSQGTAGATALMNKVDELIVKQGAVVAGGGLLLALALWAGLGWWRRTWVKRVIEEQEMFERNKLELARVSDLYKRQKEDMAKQESDLRAFRTAFDEQVAEQTAKLTEKAETLQAELNERKHQERTMAQTTSELARSKDVLELHVQARAQELERLQRQYESILNSAGEGIYGLDLRGRTTFVNPTAATLTGWSVDELVGRNEQEVFHRLAESEELEDEDEGQHAVERTFYRKDGSTMLVEYVRTPLREADCEVGAVVMFKDITERKRSEEALGRKAAELARSNAELEQFAYVASHDLQEPLRKIQAFGDRLKRKCADVQLNEGQDYLERMQSAAARMQTLINDLLTFSRVISNSQPFAPVDLGVVTQEVLSDLEVRIERTNAKVEVGELPTIDADPLQMRQLLQNLIGNAMKFSKPGTPPEVKVYAEIKKDPLSDGEGVSADTCEICVEDNGIGFEEKYGEKIFAVFQRLHGRTEYEGTGVGLAVCRRIADRHEGTVHARSELGKGAKFVVTLPVKQKQEERDEQHD